LSNRSRISILRLVRIATQYAEVNYITKSSTKTLYSVISLISISITLTISNKCKYRKITILVEILHLGFQ